MSEWNALVDGAGCEGQLIACPCGAEVTVYHFAWTALVCMTCGQQVDKPDWSLTK